MKVWIDWTSYSLLAANLEVTALAASIAYLARGGRKGAGIPLVAASLAGVYLVLWPVVLYSLRRGGELGIDVAAAVAVYIPLLAVYLAVEFRESRRPPLALSAAALVLGASGLALRLLGIPWALAASAAAFYASALALPADLKGGRG